MLSCLDSCFIKLTSLGSCIRTFFLRTTLKNAIKNSNNPQSPAILVREGSSPRLTNHHPTEILMLGDQQGLHSAPTHVQEVHLIIHKPSQDHFTFFFKKSGYHTGDFPSLLLSSISQVLNKRSFAVNRCVSPEFGLIDCLANNNRGYFYFLERVKTVLGMMFFNIVL